MAVEERNAVALRSGLREAIAWRWVAEWFRRHPRDLWLRRVSLGGHGDALRVFVVRPAYRSQHADLLLGDQDGVRFFTNDWQFEVAGLREMTLGADSSEEILDRLCADLQLTCRHSPLPPTSKRTLCYRVIAGILEATAFHGEVWRCESVVETSPSAELRVRQDLLAPFPQVALAAPRHAYPPASLKEDAFGHWVITRDGDPRACLAESGVAYVRGGGPVDFYELFRRTKRPGKPGRVMPVVAAVGEGFLP